MGKKMVRFPSMFKKRSNDQWQWPSSCKHPATYSFRAAGFENDDDLMFKTVNSIFLDPCISDQTLEDNPSYCWFTNSEYSDTSEQAEDHENVDDELEQIIRGVRSDRLFFEPCNSILSTTTTSNAHVVEEVYDDDTLGGTTSTNVCYNDVEELPFKESVVLAMESEDPYEDFKGSMLEMVESHGLKDWECLEELLEWYLKMNGKMNHGIIVQAFVDLLVGLASDDSTSFSSAASSFSTSSSSPLSTTSRTEICNHDHM
ncbi:Transcription repressor [Heracleum sosnowskyi]|uniref:Transcription repressor n=1 Tax=Heracleum sosnowskyi TaxID=360622 RepID=A0AAD8ICX5_9APIA|nr:Transcription repressor [Heracleum sosnowskyi]